MKRLRLGLVESFVIVIVLLFGFDLAWNYYKSISDARRTAQNQARQISHNIKNDLAKITEAAEAILLTTKAYYRMGAKYLADTRLLNASFMSHMKIYPFITSINTGDSQGNGYLILRIGTQWKNRIKKSQEKGMVTWQELDENGRDVATEKRPDDYDPRIRPWYVKALRQRGIVWSDPYVFRTTRDMGITASLRLQEGSDAPVVAIDIMLKDLAAFLAEQVKDIPGQEAYLVTADGSVLAASELDHFQGLLKKDDPTLPSASDGTLPLLAAAIQAESKGEAPGSFTIEGREFFALKETIMFSSGQPFSLVLALPAAALTGDFAPRALWGMGIFLLVVLAGGGWYIWRFLLPLKKLTAAMRQIGAGEFQAPGADETRNDEIGDMASELVKMEKELVQQHEKISESSRLWRNTLDSLDDFVSVHDSQCRILKVNRPMADFLKTHPRELIGRKCYELMHASNEPPADCPHKKTLATGGAAQTEVFLPKTGRHFLVKTTPMFSPEGDVGSSVHIMRDITQQKKAQEELRASEEKYRRMYQEFYALLNAIPDSITLFDRDLRIVWANDTLAQELGLSPGELLGRHCYEVSYNRNSPCPEELCPVARSFRTGRADRQVKTNALGRIKDLRSFPIFGSDQTVINVIEVDRDITEHRALEEQLRQSQKMEAVGQLTGGIAHDFNNIMTVIMGYAHLLQMKLGPGAQQKEIAEIIKATERATSLTKSLLAFSRRQKIQLAPVGLNKIFAENVKLLDKVTGADLELVYQLAQDDPVVQADGSLIGQVMINIAANAWDAMPKGGKLTIATGEVNVGSGQLTGLEDLPPGRYGLLTMADNGSGMDDQIRAKIFEPFFTTKGVGKGTGLGLSIVYGIVEQHRGKITCESSLGQGTAFKIYLPLAEERRDERVETPSESTQPKGGDETILLAEDEETLRELADTVLGQAGYRVITARNGQEALEKFKEHKGAIDLLLLDVVMPEMNGQEVYQAIQVIQPGVKALFISGYTANILRDKGVSGQGVELLMKPVSPRLLLSKVREILDRKEQ